MAIDPISIALIGFAATKLGVWFRKKDAKDQAQAARLSYQGAVQRYGAASQDMLQRIELLSRERVGATAQLMRRAADAALLTEPLSKPFGSWRGWFGGHSYDEVIDLVVQADAIVADPPKIIDDQVNLAMGLAIGLQGIEALDHLHIVDVPILNENLTHLLDLPHFDGGAVGDVLGAVLDTPLTDLLAAPLVVFGVWRMFDNLEKTDAYYRDIQNIRVDQDSIESRTEEVLLVADRASALSTELAETGYQVWKMAWITEEIHARCGAVRPGHAALRQALAEACRNFWNTLNRRLDDTNSGVAA